MLTSPENKRVAERVLFYCAGGDLADLRLSLESLVKEYAGIINADPSSVKLVQYGS